MHLQDAVSDDDTNSAPSPVKQEPIEETFVEDPMQECTAAMDTDAIYVFGNNNPVEETTGTSQPERIVILKTAIEPLPIATESTEPLAVAALPPAAKLPTAKLPSGPPQVKSNQIPTPNHQ